MRKSLIIALILAVSIPRHIAAQEENLALGAVATASSSESARYEPAKAFDGSTATGWASGAGDPQWIIVDLGAPRIIARVILNWGIASAKDYRLEASRNGKSWKPVADRTGMAAGIREDEFAALKVKARYLRVLCVARAAGSNQYSLRELKAYATATPSEASAKTESKIDAAGSGPFVDLGCGWAFPLGDAADTLESGVFPTLAVGWRFSLGPGRLKLGLESGALFASTQDEYQVYAQYRSIAVPAGALAAYDLGLFWRLRAYAQVSGGYSATFVDYESDACEDLGVWKPYFGAAAGLGIDLARWLGVNVGARYARIFYDDNPCSYLAPELGIELRF